MKISHHPPSRHSLSPKTRHGAPRPLYLLWRLNVSYLGTTSANFYCVFWAENRLVKFLRRPVHTCKNSNAFSYYSRLVKRFQPFKPDQLYGEKWNFWRVKLNYVVNNSCPRRFSCIPNSDKDFFLTKNGLRNLYVKCKKRHPELRMIRYY